MDRHHMLRPQSFRGAPNGAAPTITGDEAGLIEAMPGSGRALYALSSRGLPLLPAAVWEEDGRLHAHFGEPLSKSQLLIRNANELDACVRALVMRRIAALLPPMLRGKCGRIEDGALG